MKTDENKDEEYAKEIGNRIEKIKNEEEQINKGYVEHRTTPINPRSRGQVNEEESRGLYFKIEKNYNVNEWT